MKCRHKISLFLLLSGIGLSLAACQLDKLMPIMFANDPCEDCIHITNTTAPAPCVDAEGHMAEVDLCGVCNGDNSSCCQNDSACNDHNYCTIDSCNSHGECEHLRRNDLPACAIGDDDDMPCNGNTGCYFVRQGEWVEQIYPIDGEPGVSAGDFYDYYSWSAHTGFEISDHISVFLYREASGEVAIFYIMDISADGSGGRYELSFSGAQDLHIIQKDDASQEDFSQVSPETGTGTIRFRWFPPNTDGFVMAPFNSEGCITYEDDVEERKNIVGAKVYKNASQTLDVDINTPFSLCYEP